MKHCYIGHIVRDGVYLMPCAFLVCCEDPEHLFAALCEQYAAYFKNLPGDIPTDLGVKFTFELEPTEINMIEPIDYDICEILINLAEECDEN